MTNQLNLTLSYQQNLEDFLKKNHPEVVDFRVLSKSLDARNSNRGKTPHYHYYLEVIGEGEAFRDRGESFPQLGELKERPIIVGAGPAGLFCALRFAEYGISSIILERGEKAHKRMIHIGKYWRYGNFDPENNVCYGEGGAGLFSDGKLITRVKSPYVQYVMNKFVEFGAPADTAYITNPHLGSNKIRQLIGKMTQSLKESGCEIRYQSRVDRLLFKDGKAHGVELRCGEKIYSPHVVLATGHSAEEVYHELEREKVQMKPKDFAIGVRVEHPRSHIDHIQYGDFADDETLGASRYRLSWENPQSKRGSYSFCMCPGGYVLSSGTDAGGIVVNGMSNYARNSRWSNSALVVTVRAGEDFSVSESLGGLKFQKEIEKKAFDLSKEHADARNVPSQRMSDFLSSKTSKELPKTSCPSGVFSSNLHSILPNFVSTHLSRALKEFDRRMKGFIDKDALLLAPETRTSAPVTIQRDKESLESLSHPGLFPCGEGAGHAGGITSAAIDGIKVAMKIIEKEKSFKL